MAYTKVFILGSHTVAYKCAELFVQAGVDVAFFENRVDKGNVPKRYLENRSIHWFFCPDREWEGISGSESKKTLLLSISNNEIIHENVLANKQMTFINLHSALLPEYRGRNCCAWAIYNGDAYTGVTWHRLTREVDKGQILWQERIRIEETDTSFTLLRKQCTIGVKLLESNLEALLNECIIGFDQPVGKSPLYLSSDRPNGGKLDFNWSGNKISCFLRCMDFGPLYELGVPTFIYQNCEYKFSKYAITKTTQEDRELIFSSDFSTANFSRDGYNITLSEIKQFA